MKLRHCDMHGAGRAIRVHLFIGEAETAEASGQWLEGKVEFKVVGVMDETALQRAALMQLRNVLDAEIAALSSGGTVEPPRAGAPLPGPA